MPSSDPSRDRILLSATRLFAERGFAGAATRDIAAVAGVNQGLIAYHFGGKESLFREVIERGLADLRSALDAQPPGVQGLLAALLSRGPLLQVIAHALLEPGSRRDWVVGKLAPLAAALRAITAREHSAEPATADPVLLLTVGAAAAGVALFAPALEAATGQPLDRDRALRTQRDVLLRSIHTDALAPRGPWAPRPVR